MGRPARRFQSALEIFEDEVGKFTPRGVSLRYINRIVVPASPIEMTEYFTVPVVATHQPDAAIEEFVSRSRSVSPDGSIATTVTFASVGRHPVEGESAFILDIELEVPTPSDATFGTLGDLVGKLHYWENHEFESSITEKCRELFQ